MSSFVCVLFEEFSFGDDKAIFNITECCNPISYLIACDQNGFDFVHHHLGREPA